MSGVRCSVQKINDRYEIDYREQATGEWKEVRCRTRQEAEEMYDMIGAEASFKVLYDLVSGDQIKQS